MLAENKQDSVIGWYRQRRHSEQLMTFREKLVHEKLKSALKNPHMIFLLLTSSRVTPSDSTHRMEYSAFTSRSRHFLNVPVLVTNLGLLEQQGYWRVSAPCSASGYSLTMNKHGSRFFSPSGLVKEVDEMNKMNDSLQVELQKACREVEESERAVEALQVEVSALRRSLREKQQNSAGKAAVRFYRNQQSSSAEEQSAAAAGRQSVAGLLSSPPHTNGDPAGLPCPQQRRRRRGGRAAPTAAGQLWDEAEGDAAGKGEETEEEQLLTQHPASDTPSF
ncbi:BRCA1-A complex subunit Abraxas 1 isoform 3-T3 [Anableps anableps]